MIRSPTTSSSILENWARTCGETKRRNHARAIRALKPERILVSPGPCSPRESGLSNDVIRTFRRKVFRFLAFASDTSASPHVRRGSCRELSHDARQDLADQAQRKDLFEGMPNPFTATAIIRSSSSATRCRIVWRSRLDDEAKSWRQTQDAADWGVSSIRKAS